MSLSGNLQNLAVRVATECKQLRTMINANQANLTGLSTIQKTSLVAAINELHTAVSALQDNQAGISDTTQVSDATWSSSKIAAEILKAKNDLMNGAASALDTLKELADAINNDANFASTVNTSLARRVRVDAAQSFSTTEQAQARTNIDAVGRSEIGDVATDFVSTFNSGLA